LDCFGREKCERGSIARLAIRSRAASLWSKTFPIALHPDDVPNDLAQRGSVQRECRVIHRCHFARRFNPLPHCSDALCGVPWPMLGESGLESERYKVVVKVGSIPGSSFGVAFSKRERHPLSANL